MLGVIGGSGLYDLIEGNEQVMKKHYGETTVVLGELSGKRCAFIPRHGKRHEIPPHMINHRANIGAFHELGVTDILATCSVGVISDFELGDLAVVRDFISFYGPAQTFFDDFSKGLKHVDMSEPYSSELIRKLAEAAQEVGVELRDGGILAHTSGPRFETKAEVKALARLGANLVGMTSVQEAILANEMGMRFANIAIVSNFASGLSEKPLTVEEVLETAKKREKDLKMVISRLVKKV